MAVIMSSFIEKYTLYSISIGDHANIHTLYKIDVIYTSLQHFIRSIFDAPNTMSMNLYVLL